MRYPPQGGTAAELEGGMAANCFDRELVDTVTSSLLAAAGLQKPGNGSRGSSCGSDGGSSGFITPLFHLSVVSTPKLQALVSTSQTIFAHAFLNFVGFQSRIF